MLAAGATNSFSYLLFYILLLKLGKLVSYLCCIQNDHDPSKLVAETPCKLLRYLVSDGSHIDADIPYAEVEVMKMCMPLLSPASGVLQFKMAEGQAMQVNHFPYLEVRVFYIQWKLRIHSCLGW